MSAGLLAPLSREATGRSCSIAAGRLQLSAGSKEDLRTESAGLSGLMCLCCTENHSIPPPVASTYRGRLSSRGNQQRLHVGAQLCPSAAQGCPAPGFPLRRGLRSPCSCLMGQRQREGMSCLHPEPLPCMSCIPRRLPALARWPILTGSALLPHQQGGSTSWQPLSWATSCFVEPTRKSVRALALLEMDCFHVWNEVALLPGCSAEAGGAVFGRAGQPWGVNDSCRKGPLRLPMWEFIFPSRGSSALSCLQSWSLLWLP